MQHEEVVCALLSSALNHNVNESENTQDVCCSMRDDIRRRCLPCLLRDYGGLGE
jgi:hypothetical protein